MFKFFDYITDICTMLLDFIVSTIVEMFNFLVMIRNGIGFGVTTVAMLPPFCRGAILSIIAIAVATYILKLS